MRFAFFWLAALVCLSFSAAAQEFDSRFFSDGRATQYGLGGTVFNDELIVLGSSKTDSSDFDILLHRLDTNLNLLETKIFGTDGLDFGAAITTAGDYLYVAGFRENGLLNDGLLMCFDANLDLVWERLLGSFSGNDQFDACTVNDEYIYLTGIQSQNGSSTLVAKYDLDGNLIWSEAFSGLGAASPQGIATFSDGSLAVVADIDNGGGDINIRYYHLDTSGAQLHSFTYVDSLAGGCKNVIITENDAVLIVGESPTPTSVSFDPVFILANQDGTPRSREFIEDSQNGEAVFSAYQLSADEFLLTGYGYDPQNLGSAMKVWHVDSNRNILGEWFFSVGAPNIGYDIQEGPRGQLFLVGTGFASDTGYIVLKTRNPYWTNVSVNELTEDVSLRVYPNPTQSLLNLEVDGLQHWELMDALGKVSIQGGNSSTIDLSSLASGNYLLRIGTDSGQFVRRVVKN